MTSTTEKPFEVVLSGEPMKCANGAFRSVAWNVDGNYCLTSASDKAVVSDSQTLFKETNVPSQLTKIFS
jgi:hypothetical protein